MAPCCRSWARRAAPPAPGTASSTIRPTWRSTPATCTSPTSTTTASRCSPCMTDRIRSAATMLALLAALAMVTSAGAQADTTVLNGAVSATGTTFTSHKLTIGAPGTINATLDWDTAAANLKLFLYDPNGALVWQSPSAGKPKTMSYPAPVAGTWKLGVKALTGSADYTLTVDYPG